MFYCSLDVGTSSEPGSAAFLHGVLVSVFSLCIIKLAPQFFQGLHQQQEPPALTCSSQRRCISGNTDPVGDETSVESEEEDVAFMPEPGIPHLPRWRTATKSLCHTV